MVAVLNGELVEKDLKHLRIENRGTTFADGLFEVVRILEGQPVFLKDHYNRMKESAAFFSIPFHYTEKDVYSYADSLISRNRLPDGEFYIELTRGPDEYRDHTYPEHPEPTFFILSLPLRKINRENWQKGVKLSIYPDLRHQLCEHKTINLLPNVMAKNFAYSTGAYDAMMFRKDERGRKYITEGGSSTYFLIKDNRVVTPEVDNILPGITRKKVINLCRRMEISVEERRVFLDEIDGADEAFLASTVSQVMPVRKIKDKDFPVIGETTKQLMKRFTEMINEEIDSMKKRDEGYDRV